MILLKAISIIFSGLPLTALGIFILLGGPDPGNSGAGVARIIAILFLLCVCFYVLPNRVLIGSSIRIYLYSGFCLLASVLFFVLVAPKVFDLPIWGILLLNIGIICGALSLFISIYIEKKTAVLPKYIVLAVIGVSLALLFSKLLQKQSSKPVQFDTVKIENMLSTQLGFSKSALIA